MTHRCRDCADKRFFSLKTGPSWKDRSASARGRSPSTWSRPIKGVSSMKLHRDLGVTQKTAWHLAPAVSASLLREAKPRSAGRSSVDETCAWRQGKEQARQEEAAGRPRHGGQDARRRRQLGSADWHRVRRDGSRDRRQDPTGLCGGSRRAVGPRSTRTIMADTMECRLIAETVTQVGEYVDMAHTGIESFWDQARLPRHLPPHESEKHLNRYVTEFSGRHNEPRGHARPDAIDC